MSITRIIFIMMLSLFLVLPAHAETAYVTDKLYAGLRPQPDKETVPVKTVSTGALLEVLERRGNFTRVRDAEGVEGWIDSTVLATEPPARVQLDSLKKQQDGLKAQLDKAAAALSQEAARSAELAKKLAEKTGDAEKAMAGRGSECGRTGSCPGNTASRSQPRGEQWYLVQPRLDGIFLCYAHNRFLRRCGLAARGQSPQTRRHVSEDMRHE